MMATMVMDTSSDDQAMNAKSALRNALRAKLKSGSSFEASTTTTTTSSTTSLSSNTTNNTLQQTISNNKTAMTAFEDTLNFNSSSTTSIQLIDVETMESDDSEDSDERSDEKDTSSTASTIPLEERRLRNRLAARKCREKRKQRIMNLEKICNNLENRISMLTTEIEGLDGQKKNLTRLLENHACVRLTPKPTAVITNTVLSK